MMEQTMNPELKTIQDNVNKIFSDSLTFTKEFLQENPSPKQIELHQALQTYQRVLALWSRQTGKSTEISNIVIFWLFTGEGATNKVGKHVQEAIYIFAPIKDQVNNLRIKILTTIEKNPALYQYVETMNTEEVITVNGNRCLFRSASPGSHIRGPTATKIVIDESQDITDDKYYADILPMGATTNAQIIEAGTPMEKNHFYQTIEASKKENSNIRIVKQVWYECPFINKEFVMMQKETQPDSLWRQEYLCEFVEEGMLCFPSSLFSPKGSRHVLQDYKFYESLQEVENNEDLIRDLHKNVPSISFTMGVDLGKKFDPTVITLNRSDKLPYMLEYQEELPLETTYTDVADSMKRLTELYTISEINVDYSNEKSFIEIANARGVPIAIDKKGETGTVIFQNRNKTEMINKARVFMEQSLRGPKYVLRLPKSAEKLLLQFQQQQYEVSQESNSRYKYYHPTNTHDDRLWSYLLSIKNLTGAMLTEDIVKIGDIWIEFNKTEKEKVTIAKPGSLKKSETLMSTSPWNNYLKRKDRTNQAMLR